jgi:hypothetical protein
MSQERYKDLNLTPPEEGFELYLVSTFTRGTGVSRPTVARSARYWRTKPITWTPTSTIASTADNR